MADKTVWLCAANEPIDLWVMRPLRRMLELVPSRVQRNLLGVYGKVLWLMLSVMILGIGHVGIHLQHRKEI